MNSLLDTVMLSSDSLALSIVVKATIALAIGLIAVRLARHSRAAVRHVILAATFVGLGLLPTASLVLPDLSIPIVRVPAPPAPATRVSDATAAPTANPSPGAPAPRSTATPSRTLSGQTLLLAAWAIGAALMLYPLMAAAWRLRHVRRCGLPWLEVRPLVGQLARDAGLRRSVDVLLHDEVPAPLTCGLTRAAILLPADAQTWSEAALRRALVHELEHVRRGDWVMQLAARALAALYWFHPMAWAAFRALCLEAERACDDAVIAREERTVYADQLVTLARRMATITPQPALSMASRSDLAARVTSLLDDRRARGRAGVAPVAIVLAVAAALVLTLAPLRAVVVTPADTGDAASAQRRTLGAGRVGRLDRMLVEFAGNGDLDEVRALIDEGANVNARVDGDGSPLIAAAREGEIEIVQLLLDRGADPNLAVEGDGNPLIMAAREGYLEVVELLLAHGARVDEVVPADENALIQASGEGHLSVVKLLVARGANVNARVWAGSAYERPRGEWRTPLNQARRGGYRDIIAFLVASGAVE